MKPDLATSVGPTATLLPWLEGPAAEAGANTRGHALLIHGQRGAGMFELALALAGGCLCEAPPTARPRVGLACGACASCSLLAARTHPDLMIVIPPALQVTLGWQGEGAETGDGESSKSKAKPSKDIVVETIREAIAFCQRTPSRGQGKLVVVHPAERMNPISSNALLKVLEEPAGETRFVLSTAAPGRLLATLRSRCQPLWLPLPARDVATVWLESQGIEQAEVLLAAAGGAPLAAIELAEQGIQAAQWLSLPKDVLSGRATNLLRWPLPTVVDALQKLCHDLLMLAAGAEPRYFPRSSMPGVERRSFDALTRCAGELRATARHAEHPWSAPLGIEALALRLRQAAKPPPSHAGAAPRVATLER